MFYRGSMVTKTILPNIPVLTPELKLKVNKKL